MSIPRGKSNRADRHSPPSWCLQQSVTCRPCPHLVLAISRPSTDLASFVVNPFSLLIILVGLWVCSKSRTSFQHWSAGIKCIIHRDLEGVVRQLSHMVWCPLVLVSQDRNVFLLLLPGSDVRFALSGCESLDVSSSHLPLSHSFYDSWAYMIPSWAVLQSCKIVFKGN